MKNLNASEGDSSGGGNPTTSTSTSNNNGNGNSNSKTVETSKLESRTTGTSTNTEVTNESVVSELKVIMKNRGLTFTEEEFEAFIATERGNHLLQNIKLTMEKDKLKLQNEEQQQALVQTNENAPNQTLFCYFRFLSFLKNGFGELFSSELVLLTI